jgi:hypothetical protein
VYLDRVDETAALYEELICKVQGVFSARVKIDDIDGEIIECHVLADKSRNVKQLVRDVQSALMAKFHVDLDYKLISVAQVDNLDSVMASSKADAPPVVETKTEMPRVQLKSFMMGYEGNNIKAVVSLSMGERVYTGEAMGNSGINSRYKTLAQAVVNAFNYNMDQSMTLTILDVQKFTINGQSAYAVAIYYRLKGREETLLGAAIIREDENMAVVKASLDALNRRVFLPSS